MKSFKQLVTEVYAASSDDEQNFIDKHEIEYWDHPEAEEGQFTSDIKKAKRDADYEEGEDEAVYESKDSDDKDGDGLDDFSKAKTKKKFSDLKDKDVDNDGDADDSDEYLHNRRKKVSKAIKADESVNVDDVDGADERTKKRKDQLAFNEETFSKGSLKLKDGSSVNISADEATALTKLLADLSPANKKKMEENMLKDKKNYQNILTFAKEAL